MAAARKVDLATGQQALVDLEDFPRVNQHVWSVHGKSARNITAYAKIPNPDPNAKPEFIGMRMHRFVAGTPAGVRIEHRNKNGLDNRRSNLSVITKWGHIPYHWDMRRQGWVAKSGHSVIGVFSDEQDAAYACAMQRLEEFGEGVAAWFPLEFLRGLRSEHPDKWSSIWPSFNPHAIIDDINELIDPTAGM